MGNSSVTIPLEEYKRLASIEAKVQSLIACVNRSKYGVDRALIGSILGFVVYEEDKTDAERT